ncbi:hypothetical protein SAMN02745166_01492 [Prosthecobacter debontii]|uniref:Uncharacterized protein n=1 Tax=Prosthecobacter debontii TaxID=48467 RepID=A0A1T4XHB4_9BACT|nr:hypothetical protein [Prosthecobacter debontii]SKA88827.1 hypothetical protein SAMN02745166_01492 [Prosthecobacter debontii]
MKSRLPFLFAPEGDGAGGGAGAATLLGEGQQQQQQPPAGGGESWSWAKEDGTLNQGWQDKLGDGLKGNSSLATIQSLPDLANAYVSTKALVGKKLEMPGEGAKPEDIANWRKVVGAPEKPEGYRGEAKNLKPEGLPDEMWNADAEAKFLALAHKHHLPPAAVKEILSFYGTSLMDTLQASKGDEAEMLKAEGLKLQQTWGKDYQANITVAAQMAKMVGLDPHTDPIFTNARAVEAFAKMAKLVSEDKLVTGEQPSLSTSARARANDIVDPKSTSVISREYRGEFGPERQAAAQQQYHQLLQALQSAQ